jgi:TrmH family RNA methyltransferase
MTRRISITSSANDRLKTARQLARGRRCEDGVFLVEGHRQLRSALEAGAVVREVFAAPELFLGTDDERLVALAEQRGARVYELGEPAFRTLSTQARADGLAATVERWPTMLSRLDVADEPLVVVAESIERPGNLGAIVRTACAAGADALVICDPVTGPFHRDAVRGSVGALFRLPLAVASGKATRAWLAERALRLVVTSPCGVRAHCDAAAEGGLAVVVGSERHGVTRFWLDAADEVVSVPMPGPVDSLNVAVATGIILFDLSRRR